MKNRLKKNKNKKFHIRLLTCFRKNNLPPTSKINKKSAKEFLGRSALAMYLATHPGK
jgi:hypothetical protein